MYCFYTQTSVQPSRWHTSENQFLIPTTSPEIPMKSSMKYVCRLIITRAIDLRQMTCDSEGNERNLVYHRDTCGIYEMLCGGKHRRWLLPNHTAPIIQDHFAEIMSLSISRYHDVMSSVSIVGSDQMSGQSTTCIASQSLRSDAEL